MGTCLPKKHIADWLYRGGSWEAGMFGGVFAHSLYLYHCLGLARLLHSYLMNLGIFHVFGSCI